jgi:hypothetical protein
MARLNESPLPLPCADAVFKRLPEGGVLFSTVTEVYFGVGEVGARIWELLPPASQTVDEMVAILAAKYRDVPASTIRTDVERFLVELLANGLVAHDPPRSPGDKALP